MKKHILILVSGLVFSLLVSSSCQNSNSSTNNENQQDSVLIEEITQVETPIPEEKEEETEVKETDYSNQETFVNVYRSDGFRPNMVSEWVQIRTNSDMSKILEILYWNVQNEDKMKLEIVSQNYSEGEEISGYTGEVRFPNDNEIFDFGMIEDRFNLSPKEGRMQEFFYEEN